MAQNLIPAEQRRSNDNVVALEQRKPQPVQAFSLDELVRIAEAIARGGLFGSSDVNAVLTLCMVAHAEGQHPASVFRDYNIIKGRPSKSAEAMQRDFLQAGGRIEWLYLADDGAEAKFSHPRGGTCTIRWDMARAQQAGLLGRSGGPNGEPNMWSKYPRPLFRARVLSEGIRTIYPAATGGMYEPGEVYDITDEQPGNRRHFDNKPQLSDEQYRANAEEWVKRQLERVEQCDVVEAVEGLMTASRERMRKLARNAADLYQKVQEAYEAKVHALQGYDPVSGTTAEQRESGQAEPPGDELYWTFERRLDQCRDMKDVERVDKDWLKIRAAQDEENIGLIDDMIQRRRKSFRRK